MIAFWSATVNSTRPSECNHAAALDKPAELVERPTGGPHAWAGVEIEIDPRGPWRQPDRRGQHRRDGRDQGQAPRAFGDLGSQPLIASVPSWPPGPAPSAHRGWRRISSARLARGRVAISLIAQHRIGAHQPVALFVVGLSSRRAARLATSSDRGQLPAERGTGGRRRLAFGPGVALCTAAARIASRQFGASAPVGPAHVAWPAAIRARPTWKRAFTDFDRASAPPGRRARPAAGHLLRLDQQTCPGPPEVGAVEGRARWLGAGAAAPEGLSDAALGLGPNSHDLGSPRSMISPAGPRPFPAASGRRFGGTPGCDAALNGWSGRRAIRPRCSSPGTPSRFRPRRPGPQQRAGVDREARAWLSVAPADGARPRVGRRALGPGIRHGRRIVDLAQLAIEFSRRIRGGA